jgi:5-formyltetrahydrofolate cyclo-ligase
MSDTSPSKEMRLRLREARRSLPDGLRLQHEVRIANHLLHLPEIRRCRRLALYQSEDGEVDLHLLMLALARDGIDLCLPVLRPGGDHRLWFAPYRPGTRLQRNRFGIAEPDTRRFPPLPLRRLDLVLLPLVGFDDQLNRLGMGGGFYDRTFAFRRHGTWRKPQLIGIAHECQRLDRLEHRTWDVPMDAVVTENGVYRGKSEKNPEKI